ncbi:hypothetical protein K0M31_013140, partial [Melipona bicolor]
MLRAGIVCKTYRKHVRVQTAIFHVVNSREERGERSTLKIGKRGPLPGCVLSSERILATDNVATNV